jgi:hypothetical protein
MLDLYKTSWEVAGYQLTEEELDILFGLGVRTDMQNVHFIVAAMRRGYDYGYQAAGEDECAQKTILTK